MRYFIVCVIAAALLLNSSFVFAQDIKYDQVTGGQVNEALDNTTHVRFLPTSFFYYLVRTKELFSRFFKASSRDRAQFDYVLSSKRLKEAYLLARSGDYKGMGNAMSAYGKALVRTEDQLFKARSQNQEILPIVEKIAANLGYQETILVALENDGEQNGVKNGALDRGIASFSKFVSGLDEMKPGLKGRYKVLTDFDSDPIVSPNPSPQPSLVIESSSSTKPRRIIY
ncbi:MAG: hypothetical protein AAB512_01360 [Patescibacteria group bacterium]